MISAHDYYHQIARPTVDEFTGNRQSRGNLRLAMLACASTLHVIDYVMQNCASDAKEGDKLVKAYTREAEKRCFSFEVVRGFALASKHCTLSSKRGFHSGRYKIATPYFVRHGRVGAMSTMFLSDKVGGITVRWTDRGHVNLTKALKKTLEFFEAEFPELRR